MQILKKVHTAKLKLKSRICREHINFRLCLKHVSSAVTESEYGNLYGNALHLNKPKSAANTYVLSHLFFYVIAVGMYRVIVNTFKKTIAVMKPTFCSAKCI